MVAERSGSRTQQQFSSALSCITMAGSEKHWFISVLFCQTESFLLLKTGGTLASTDRTGKGYMSYLGNMSSILAIILTLPAESQKNPGSALVLGLQHGPDPVLLSEFHFQLVCRGAQSSVLITSTCSFLKRMNSNPSLHLSRYLGIRPQPHNPFLLGPTKIHRVV